ncbi:copper amine oxidase N-terminal domain-containing protein [Lysinibacillus sp. G4S2]|uniref:copper amine oxidase N-terminal domain-containing protein n=1 Tax=Lysinibacillus sp. G4S2 TaxID=3055859 RepID=UPI0025A28CF2|nr:copper amine oxidase N-terminal domain-containing protein [Lysinibacillus sp. G4S2]MDM5248787.1 copper amine oxidase N-terminal domain-containing protein [Lysinibacillus sp. G4S2]
MKKEKIGLIVVLLLASFIPNGVVVHADDDKHEYKEHKEYKDHDDDDDDDEHDEDEEGEETYYFQDAVSEKGSWNIWTRTVVTDKEVLPFTNSQKVTLKVEGTNKELNFSVIPKDGEFFVPGKTVAQVLGAKATFYKESKILAIQFQDNELLFRAGTNVVYDNNVKTPSPAQAFYVNEELYVPISTITNGLGYIAEWQESNQTFVCQPITN